MAEDKTKFQKFMDNLVPLLDEWSITEYKMHQMSLMHLEIPQALVTLKSDTIDKVEKLIMEYNLPELQKLYQ